MAYRLKIERIVFVSIIALVTGGLAAPASFAQDHGEAGVFADYFRFEPAQTNFAGVGGRLSINVAHHLALEAEMNYDFDQVFSETYHNGINTSVVSSNLRLLHGLFGPKLQVGNWARLFVTAKGGFLNSDFTGAKPGPGFTSQVSNLRADDVVATFYPGGGAEMFLGPIGLRLDVGDEIYFDNGAHNNFRLTFGPHLRF